MSRTAKLQKVMDLRKPFTFRLAAAAMLDTDKGKVWPVPSKKVKR